MGVYGANTELTKRKETIKIIEDIKINEPNKKTELKNKKI